jgi:hypothetical protein
MTQNEWSTEIENEETGEPIADHDTVEHVLSMIDGVEFVEHGVFAGNALVHLTKDLEEQLEEVGYLTRNYGPYLVTVELS